MMNLHAPVVTQGLLLVSVKAFPKQESWPLTWLKYGVIGKTRQNPEMAARTKAGFPDKQARMCLPKGPSHLCPFRLYWGLTLA